MKTRITVHMVHGAKTAPLAAILTANGMLPAIAVASPKMGHGRVITYVVRSSIALRIADQLRGTVGVASVTVGA